MSQTFDTSVPFPTIAIPAPHSVLARVLVRAAVVAATWDQRRRTRKHLRDLPDHMFNDIGLTAEQAQSEAAKYFWRA